MLSPIRAVLPLLALLQAHPLLGQSRIEGVVEAAGLPANRVWVALQRDGETAASTWTDRSGRFSLADIDGGDYNLVLTPDSDLLRDLTRTVKILTGQPLFLDSPIALELEEPLPVAVRSFAGTVMTQPGTYAIPSGRVELFDEDLRLGTAYLNDGRNWELPDALVPLGEIEVRAGDPYGIFEPGIKRLTVAANAQPMKIELSCRLRWWPPVLIVLILALPAIQELLRRRLRARRALAEVRG